MNHAKGRDHSRPFFYKPCCANLPAMKIEGDYQKDGYALVRELIPREVAQAFTAMIKRRSLWISPLPDQREMGA